MRLTLLHDFQYCLDQEDMIYHLHSDHEVQLIVEVSGFHQLPSFVCSFLLTGPAAALSNQSQP